MKIIDYDHDNLDWLVLQDDAKAERRYVKTHTVPQPARPDVIADLTGLHVHTTQAELPDKIVVDIPAGQWVTHGVAAANFFGSHEFAAEKQQE